jgi:predicted HicB family RNase H-like nuclease
VDPTVTSGKKAAKPQRSAERQVFIGGYVSAELAARFKKLAAEVYGISVNSLIVHVIEEKVRLGDQAKNGEGNV